MANVERLVQDTSLLDNKISFAVAKRYCEKQDGLVANLYGKNKYYLPFMVRPYKDKPFKKSKNNKKNKKNVVVKDDDVAIKHAIETADKAKSERDAPQFPRTWKGVFGRISWLANYQRKCMREENPKKTPKLTMGDALNIICSTIPFCEVPNGFGNKPVVDLSDPVADRLISDNISIHGSVYVYDIRRGIYIDPMPMASKFISAIFGESSPSLEKAFMSSLSGFTATANGRYFLPYVPMPVYKIVVGNGVYNCLTRQLEGFDPRYMAMSSIDVDFKPKAVRKLKKIGFDKLNYYSLANSFANGNDERVKLINQITKSVILGYAPKDTSFFVYGQGGDGKSTFFSSMLANVIGRENVSHLTLTTIEKSDENKLAEIDSAKLILGTDNNSGLFLKNTEMFKRIVTHDPISVRCIYDKPRSIASRGMMIQLVNEMPRFSESGNAIRRRFGVLKAKNSYVQNGTDSVKVDQLVSSRAFCEHVLAIALTKLPYYKGYNQVDSDAIEGMAADSNPVMQFMQALLDIDFFGNGLRAVPVADMYAAYFDWFTATMGSGKPLSRNKFKQQVTLFMEKLGFKDETDRIRSNQFVTQYNYDKSLFSAPEMRGNAFEGLSGGSTRVDCFIRDEEHSKIKDAVLMGIVRQKDELCSVYDYFGVTDLIFNEMTMKEMTEYNNLVDEQANNPDLDPDPNPDPFTPETDDDEDDDDEDKGDSLYFDDAKKLELLREIGEKQEERERKKRECEDAKAHEEVEAKQVAEEKTTCEKAAFAEKHPQIAANSAFGNAFNARDFKAMLNVPTTTEDATVSAIVTRTDDMKRAIEKLNIEEPALSTTTINLTSVSDPAIMLEDYKYVVNGIIDWLKGNEK